MKEKFVIAKTLAEPFTDALAEVDGFMKGKEPGIFLISSYGKGKGKSTLLQAIKSHCLSKTPQPVTFCLTANQFSGNFIMSLRKLSYQLYKQSMELPDVLLIDDIEETYTVAQEELLRLLNHHKGRAFVILTADVSREEATKLLDKIRSEIHPKEYFIENMSREDKIGILSHKLSSDWRKSLIDEEQLSAVLNLIAETSEDLHDVERWLYTVLTMADLMNERVTLAFTEYILKDAKMKQA